jgi:hypothetical protein
MVFIAVPRGLNLVEISCAIMEGKIGLHVPPRNYALI